VFALINEINVVNYSANPKIVIVRSETTCLHVMHRQANKSIFTPVGLLHFLRNDTLYSPLPSIPSRQWEGKLLYDRYFPILFPRLMLPPFSVMLDLIQHLIPDPEINSG